MTTTECTTINRTLHLVIYGEHESNRGGISSGRYRYHLDEYYDTAEKIANIKVSNKIDLAEHIYLEAIANCPEGVMDYIEHIDDEHDAITSWTMTVYCSGQNIAAKLKKSVTETIERESLSQEFTTCIYDLFPEPSIVILSEDKLKKLLKNSWTDPDVE